MGKKIISFNLFRYEYVWILLLLLDLFLIIFSFPLQASRVDHADEESL